MFFQKFNCEDNCKAYVSNTPLQVRLGYYRDILGALAVKTVSHPPTQIFINKKFSLINHCSSRKLIIVDLSFCYKFINFPVKPTVLCIYPWRTHAFELLANLLGRLCSPPIVLPDHLTYITIQHKNNCTIQCIQ